MRYYRSMISCEAGLRYRLLALFLPKKTYTHSGHHTTTTSNSTATAASGSSITNSKPFMAFGAKVKHPMSSSLSPNPKLAAYLSLFFFLWLILLFLCFPSRSSTTVLLQSSSSSNDPRPAEKCDQDIARLYVYDLPPRFNRALLGRCRSLSMYTDMCPHVAHRGLGQPLPESLLASTSNSSWYATHQFIAEMIFHARAERHPCRTVDPHLAELFYVPFYGGLYASSQFPERDLVLRDALALDLADHLAKLPSWRRREGRDHFLALGRTAWDFMRRDDNSSADFGANRLLMLPELANMTVLTVERHPWQGRNQRGIPYPSYFHPSSGAEVAAWQAAARRGTRTHLFAFVGGPRVGLEKAAVRADILRQCGASARCLRVVCSPGSAECHEPGRVLEVMRKAEFCMQPPGDSFTRRSVFDAVLAGCVPVFFSEHTAYTQYHWYAPARPEEWSVSLGADRWGRIEEELARIPRSKLQQMRERVIQMIPGLTYAHPNASQAKLGFRDAVDVALVELTKLVRSTPQDL